LSRIKSENQLESRKLNPEVNPEDKSPTDKNILANVLQNITGFVARYNQQTLTLMCMMLYKVGWLCKV